MNKSTGWLHPVGKPGITVLAQHMATLSLDEKLRESFGQEGKNRVKQHFMERHMARRIAEVLKKTLDLNEQS